MDATTGFEAPILTYLLAILGLLVIWQYYQIQVMKGRILAVDVFDRSGIRFYIYVVPADQHTCVVCREAHGRVFLPSQVMKKEFTPLNGQCTNPSGCMGVLVGLYGAWSEARQLLERLRMLRKKASLRLSDEEILVLISGSWERSISATTDRIGVHMLEAVAHERTNPEVSIVNYRYVGDQAKEVRHLGYIVPAYFRLASLLADQGRLEEAIEVIEKFEARFKGKKAGPHAPTEKQMGLMSIKKSRLRNSLRPAEASA